MYRKKNNKNKKQEQEQKESASGRLHGITIPFQSMTLTDRCHLFKSGAQF